MEISELSIKDWVQVPFLIDNVENFKAYFQIKQLRDCDLDVIGFKELKYDEIKPIPITPEILEKNEFKKFNFLHIEGQHQWIWWKNTLLSVTLWCRELNDNIKDGMMIKIETPTSNLCIKINYVHELQHILRLCEIEKEIVL